MAIHYMSRDIYLAQALRFMSEKYNGNSLTADFALSKLQVEFMDAEKVEKILRETGIQIGYSPLVEEMNSLDMASRK